MAEPAEALVGANLWMSVPGSFPQSVRQHANKAASPPARRSIIVGPVADVTQSAPRIIAPAAATAVAAAPTVPVVTPAASSAPAALFPTAASAPTVLFPAAPASGTAASTPAASTLAAAAASTASFRRRGGGRQDCAEGERCDRYGRDRVANWPNVHCILHVTCWRHLHRIDEYCTRGVESLVRFCTRLLPRRRKHRSSRCRCWPSGSVCHAVRALRLRT
jgi:hypothetical protein